MVAVASQPGICLNDNPAMTQLASLLKNDEVKPFSISNLKIDFKIEQGNIIVGTVYHEYRRKPDHLLRQPNR